MNYSNEIKLILAICAQDEVISSVELNSTFDLSNDFCKITKKDFDLIVDAFFIDELTIEEYFFYCDSDISKKRLIEMCKTAATSDGFSIRENYGFLKLCKLADLDPESFISDEI
jgi:hypothetical protein